MTTLPADTQALVDLRLQRVQRLAALQSSLFSFLHSLSELLMATNAELLQQIADLKQAVVDDQTSDQAVVTRLDELIAQQAAGAIDGAGIAAALADVKAQIVPVTSVTP